MTRELFHRKPVKRRRPAKAGRFLRFREESTLPYTFPKKFWWGVEWRSVTQKLKKQAELFDLVVDNYNKVRRRTNFPKKISKDVAELFFPEIHHLGGGFYKEAYLIRSKARKLVLKLANKRSINQDWKLYSSLPANLRNRYFTKIYWRTKYCLLQKLGEEEKIPKDEMKKLKEFGKKFGLTDIKPDNVRKVDGRFKIVDANFK